MTSSETLLATLAADLRHLTSRLDQYTDDARDRFDRIEDRLDRGDKKFQVAAERAAAEAAERRLADRVFKFVIAIGSAVAGILGHHFWTAK